MQKRQRTVLIIDDEPADRLTYRRYLAQDPAYEYTVLEAEHGDQAMAICRETRPDCIILDYRLPNNDGLAVLQRLTAVVHPHQYPVVMLTGVGNTMLAVQAIQSGIHDYLSKEQVTPAQLQRAVNNAIEKVELQRALAHQREWFRVALTSIGDAVIATDVAGYVTFLNPVAEALTGWDSSAAQGQPLEQIFCIVHEETRQSVANPVASVLRTGATVGLANHTLLLAKDGREIPIDDSAAPIRDAQGNLLGVVLIFRDITERRQAESEIATRNRQLQQRVQELQTLLEVSPVGISLANDPECRRIWTNPVLRDLLRLPDAANASLTPAAAVEQPTYRVYRNGQEVPPAEMPMQYATRHGVTVRDVELEIVHPDGTQHTLLKSVEPLFDEGGQVRGCIAFNIDITARKRAEEELRAAQNFAQQITDIMPDVLYVYDLVQQRPTYINRNGAQQLGHAPTAVQAQGTAFIAQTMHAEDAVRFRQHHQVLRRLPDGEVAEFEYRMRSADDWRWFRSRDRAFRRAADGAVQQIIGVATDFTARKQAEEALRASEEQLRLAVEAAQIGFWEWDIVTDQITWGGYHEQLFGLQPGEFGGTYKAFLALVHPADRAMLESMVAAILHTSAPYGQEFRIIRPDGELRWMKSLGKLYRNPAGLPLSLVGAVYDITPLKASEEALQAINATLEARIAERTAELAKSRRELEHFINIATYDLRDTVRGIDYLVGWLREDAEHLLPAPSQQHLRTLRNRVHRLEAQLGDLLAYAHAGRQEDALRRVDSQALLMEILQSLEAPSSFCVTTEAPLPTLITERTALETVLRHLIDNAIKHHHRPQHGHLHIAVKRQADWLEFILTDDGPGIAPDHHALIFDMFHTLQPRSEAKGNGVGLAIVQKVVESWGGRITVDSQPGQGTTFRFTWPL